MPIRHAPLAAFLYSLFIQNHCAKSENPWFFKTNSGNVNEPLLWEVRFLSETDNGDFRVCLIRFNPPFRLRPVFSSKIIAPNRGSWGLGERTPEVLTNLSCGRFVFYWGIEEGIEVLAKPIFVRGVSPFYGWHAPCLAGTPRAPFNGSNAAHFLWKRDALCPFAGGGWNNIKA